MNLKLWRGEKNGIVFILKKGVIKMKLRQEINNIRDTINGELNRIMVTDDIEEIRGLTYYLFCNINELIRKNQQRIAKSLRGEEND